MKSIRTLADNPRMLGMVELREPVVYTEINGEKLDFYMIKPMWKSEGNGFPLVVFIQGSAWTQPKRFWEIPQLSRLARMGFVVATVTHRSCFTVPAPAFLEDVKTAIRFLRAHAEEYDIDPKRVCAWGTSSGGNTALLLGLTGDDTSLKSDEYAEQSDKVQLVVDCFGPTDLIKMATVQYAGALDSDTADLDNVLYLLAGRGNTPECMDRLRKISPIGYAEKGHDYPPFLILHGDNDPVVLFEDSLAFYEKMSECGYDMEMVRVHNAPHEGSFWSEALLEIIFNYISERL